MMTIALDKIHLNNDGSDLYQPIGCMATFSSESSDCLVATVGQAIDELPGKLSSIVWISSTENVKHMLTLPEESFIDVANDCFWKQYPKNQLVSNATKTVESLIANYSQTVRQIPPSIKSLYEKSRAAFPLGFGHTSTYACSVYILLTLVRLFF